jgi:hypothetical protein
VHDVAGSEDAEGLDQLLKIGENPGLGETAVPANVLVEGASVAELVEEVEVVDGLEDLNEADDVRGVDAREHLDLVEGALLQLRVLLEAPDVDHLRSHLAASAPVDSAVDLAVLSLSDLLVQRVVLNDLNHPLTLKLTIT